MNENDPFVRGQTNMKYRIMQVLNRRKVQLQHQCASAQRTVDRITAKTPPTTAAALRTLLRTAERRCEEIENVIERVNAVRREAEPGKQ